MSLKESEYSHFNIMTKSQKTNNKLAYFDSRSRKF
jgi:hypothetical protein